MNHIFKVSLGTIASLFLLIAATSAQDSWQATNGPDGGAVKAIAINSLDEVFIASGSGIFRSGDNGGSWEKSNNGINSSFFTGFAVNDSDHIFVGTTNLGIYRSVDNGANWETINTGLPKNDVKSIDVAVDGELIIGINGGGVYRSQDNGESWTEFNNGLDELRVYTTAVSAEGDLYAGSLFTGAYRYLAGDTTWRQVSNGLTTLRCNALETNPTGDVFAGTSSGMFMLNKGDTTWSELKNGTQSLGYVTSIYVAEDGGLFAATLVGAFKYDTLAAVWTDLNNGLSNPRTWGFATNSNGQMFVINDAGVSRSEDGGANWTYQVNGLKISNIANMHAFADGTLLAATENNGVARSLDGGENWSYSNSGLTSLSTKSIIVDSSGTVFVGVSGVNGVYRSTDKGNSWTFLQNVFTSATVGAFAVNKTRVYASPSSAVFFSEDGGDNWQAVPLDGLSNKNIRGLAVNAENTLFAGTWNGGVFRIGESDTAWTQVNNGLSSLLINTLQINAAGTLFAATQGGGVFRSDDEGDNWVQVNEGLPTVYVRTLYISQRGYLFAGTFGIVAYSLDNGDSWTDLSEGLETINISAITEREDGALFVGSLGDGVFSHSALVTSVNNKTGLAPRSFVLKQNYPNPFNPVTTISFTMAHASKIRVQVFNISGQIIRTLFEGRLSAGQHALIWDGKNEQGGQVVSGAYFYTVETARFKSTKKMILLR